MKAKIKMKNTTKNQEIGRKIRDSNHKDGNLIEISFNSDLSEIFFEGEEISITQKEWFSNDMLVEGQLKEKENGYIILPKDKGKTINLYLDSELVKELNEIRRHVISKTQHDIVLEVFKKGLDHYKKE
ncbi:hypothetical protein [Niallia sp. 01092]|uniref:hypothetical protein n=1 Tax=unclassified Niallia TaxID=2837522 RepID=UPI003FD1D7FC